MKPASSVLALWGWPIVIAVLSAIGLVGGLWGDGAWDWLAWGCLGLPVVVAAWFGLGRRSVRR